MASAQADALSAHSALRRRIVENLKRNHPDAFATAERSMGMRMSDVEDDVLISYLDALTERNNATTEVPAHDGLEAVRQVLLRAGVPIPDSVDVLAWAPIIEKHLDRLNSRPPATRGGVEPRPETAPPSAGGGLAGRVGTWTSPPLGTTADPPAPAPAPTVEEDPAETTDTGGEDEFEYLEEDFDAITPGDEAAIEALLAEIDASKNTPPTTTTPAPPAGDDLDDLFDDTTSGAAADTVDERPMFGGPATPAPAAPGDLDDLFDGVATSPAAGSGGEPAGIFGGGPEPAPAAPGDLDDLFDGVATPPAAGSGGDLADVFDDPSPGPVDDGDLSDIFDDPSPGPLDDGDLTGIFDDVPAPTPGDSDLTDIFDDPAPGPVDDGDLTDIFGDDPAPACTTEAGTPATEDLKDLFDGGPATPPTSTSRDDDLAGIFDDGDAPNTMLSDLFAETTDTPAPSGDNPGPGDAAASGGKPPTEVTDTPREEAKSATPASTVDAATAAALFSEPVRPQLVPTQRRRRNRGNRKTPRTRAVSADRDTPAEASDTEPVELDTGSRNAILAAVAIPRPVFIADLEAVAGGRTAVEAWEDEMRTLKMKAPVRLIGGKPRHRALGALVIPYGDLRDASTEFTQSWWADCMGTYTGGKLHELGVLLRRVGTQVASATFTEHTAVLRLNTPRGLIGVVAVCGTELDAAGATRAETIDELSKLARERLSLIAVLTTTADQSDVDRICDAVTTEAAEQQWPPTTPIVTAHSWEWDDTAGTTMKLLHGG